MSTPRSAITITPNNDTDLTRPISQLYVGQAGDIEVILSKDTNPVILKAVPIGTMLYLSVKRIRAAGTTAALLIGFY